MVHCSGRAVPAALLDDTVGMPRRESTEGIVPRENAPAGTENGSSPYLHLQVPDRMCMYLLPVDHGSGSSQAASFVPLHVHCPDSPVLIGDRSRVLSALCTAASMRDNSSVRGSDTTSSDLLDAGSEAASWDAFGSAMTNASVGRREAECASRRITSSKGGLSRAASSQPHQFPPCITCQYCHHACASSAPFLRAINHC